MTAYEKEQIFNLIARQFPRWPSTYSKCWNESCNEFGRGGNECPKCLEGKLAEATDKKTAKKYLKLISELRHLEINILFNFFSL